MDGTIGFMAKSVWHARPPLKYRNRCVITLRLHHRGESAGASADLDNRSPRFGYGSPMEELFAMRCVARALARASNIGGLFISPSEKASRTLAHCSSAGLFRARRTESQDISG